MRNQKLFDYMSKQHGVTLLESGMQEICNIVNNMNQNTLQERYESICSEYIQEFCKKQEMDFEGWVGNTIGGIAVCNDFFFSYQDIVLDINSNQPKGLIVDWYYQNLETPEKSINYYSYTKGLRLAMIKN